MPPSQTSRERDKARTSQDTAREPQLGVIVAVVLALVAATLLADDGDDWPEVRITRTEAAAEVDEAAGFELDVATVAEHDEGLAERLEEQPDVLEPLTQAAATFDVSPELVLALAWHESRWRPDIVSHAGAVGVMQVMPGTAERVVADTDALEPPVELTDPTDNAAIGTAYIEGLLDRYDGNRRLALQAYNQGYVTLDQGGPLPSAVAFSERVVGTAELLADARDS